MKTKKSGEKGDSLFGYLAVVLAALIGLWVAAQIMSLFASAQSMSGIPGLVATAFAWTVLALAIGVVLRGVWLLRRLPDVPKVEAADYADKPEKFRAVLQHGYLARIGNAEEYVTKAGFDEKDAREVVELIGRLRSGGHKDQDWLREMRQFQERQDDRAGEIINKSMGLIAVKTAASPWKIVDSLAVFYVSSMMIYEIARVYNRRATRVGAMRLAGMWAFNIYVAREMNGVAEGGVGVVTGAAGRLMKPNGLTGAIASSLPLVGKIASKAVEGGANALFARFLGKRAIREFQPVAY